VAGGGGQYMENDSEGGDLSPGSGVGIPEGGLSQ